MVTFPEILKMKRIIANNLQYLLGLLHRQFATTDSI